MLLLEDDNGWKNPNEVVRMSKGEVGGRERERAEFGYTGLNRMWHFLSRPPWWVAITLSPVTHLIRRVLTLFAESLTNHERDL